MMNSSGDMLFGGVLMWLFWILLAVGLVAVIRISLGGVENRKQETALEVLKRRFARGEIDEATFLRQRQELEES